MRDKKVDILRVIGTLLVILAHVSAPKAVIGLRTFDVCTLVMISGVSYVLSSNKKKSYQQYVVSRIKRLCLPAYFTAISIFALCGILCSLVGRQYPYTLQQVIETFLFIGGRSGGIGYFWIVRIYLLIALCFPVLQKINLRIKNNTYFTGTVLVLLGVNELVFRLLFGRYGAVCDMLLENYVLSCIGYSTIALVGMRAKSDIKIVNFMLPILALMTIISIISSKGQYLTSLSNYKYPPQFTYLVYGLFISLLLWRLLDLLNIDRFNVKFIGWFSKKSFSIYLAHILLLFLISWADKYIGEFAIMKLWITKYFIIVISSIGIILLWELSLRFCKRKRG